jgi:hypothetical protein
MQIYFDTLWTRTRQARIGFLAGLIVGVLMGWFFHGVISFVIRFFFVIVLLVPLVLALYAWFRFRREFNRMRSRQTEDDWPPMARRPYRTRPGEPFDEGTITVEGWETWEGSERRRSGDWDARREP